MSTLLRPGSRLARVALGGGAAAFARSLMVLNAFVSVKTLVPYLGPERYGVMAAITSLTAVLSFADLGLGNGLITALSRTPSGPGGTATSQRFVSSAFFATAGLAVVWGVVAVAVVPNVTVLSSPGAPYDGARHAAWAFAAVFCLVIPLSVIPKIHIGLQENHIASAFSGLGSLVSLVSVVVLARTEGTLPQLVVATVCGPVVAAVANAAYLFGFRRPWLT
ncbi:MAG: hypothetical protein JNG84_15575, partial [Archangium sp.]|nr:hypothetical protein [Archangium sp.]